jgi:hypothetical protein
MRNYMVVACSTGSKPFALKQAIRCNNSGGILLAGASI